jgi:hypothetical protein
VAGLPTRDEQLSALRMRIIMRHDPFIDIGQRKIPNEYWMSNHFTEMGQAGTGYVDIQAELYHHRRMIEDRYGSCCSDFMPSEHSMIYSL